MGGPLNDDSPRPVWAADLEGVVHPPMVWALPSDSRGFGSEPVDPEASSWGESDGSEADRRHWLAVVSTREPEARRSAEVILLGSDQRSGRRGRSGRIALGPGPLCFTCGQPRSSHPGNRFCRNCAVCGRFRSDHPDGRCCPLPRALRAQRSSQSETWRDMIATPVGVGYFNSATSEDVESLNQYQHAIDAMMDPANWAKFLSRE